MARPWLAVMLSGIGALAYTADLVIARAEEMMLAYRLTAEERYTAGPVVISFALTNRSDQAVWVLTWYTPLEGIKGKIFQVQCDGEEVVYEGPLVKRADPGPEEYIRLDPGETVSVNVDLSSVYHFPSGVRCKIAFAGRFYDIVFDDGLVPRSREDHEPVDIPGDASRFRVQ